MTKIPKSYRIDILQWPYTLVCEKNFRVTAINCYWFSKHWEKNVLFTSKYSTSLWEWRPRGPAKMTCPPLFISSSCGQFDIFRSVMWLWDSQTHRSQMQKWRYRSIPYTSSKASKMSMLGWWIVQTTVFPAARTSINVVFPAPLTPTNAVKIPGLKHH